jgi:hypothetical protein
LTVAENIAVVPVCRVEGVGCLKVMEIGVLAIETVAVAVLLVSAVAVAIIVTELPDEGAVKVVVAPLLV